MKFNKVLQLQYKKLHISFRCNSTLKVVNATVMESFPLFHPLIHHGKLVYIIIQLNIRWVTHIQISECDWCTRFVQKNKIVESTTRNDYLTLLLQSHLRHSVLQDFPSVLQYSKSSLYCHS